MNSVEMGSVVLTFCVLLASIHSLGFLFEKMRQPKLIGEICAGVLLGPFVLGRFSPEISTRLFGTVISGSNKMDVVLSFMYWIGLILLMFISGSETRKLISKENRKETAWILGIGTPLPFIIVLGIGLTTSLLNLQAITGTAGQPTSSLLVLAIAVSVTSIPVISRIFYDLGIIHTRFASLILGSAVLEDIILWGVLAVSSGIARSATLAQQVVVSDITSHIFVTFLYMGIGLTVAPRLLKYLHGLRSNFLIRASPVAYVLLILFSYAAIAAAFDINLIFAAFIAGFGVIGGVNGSERERFSPSIEAINKIGFALFIPIYFVIVGYKLNLGREFSVTLLLSFLLGSSLLSILSAGLAARLAGFKGLDVLNLAITTNARGGPGIVLASIAFDAGIINSSFYTTLVVTAIVTSQFAGTWLRYILSKGWPLLSTNPEEGSHKFKVRKNQALTRMKSLTLGILGTCFLGVQSWGQSGPNQIDIPIPDSAKAFFDHIDFTGSNVEIKWREQGALDGRTQYRQAQDILDFKSFVRIDSQGKWKVMGSAQTGSTYRTREDNLGIGNDSTRSFTLNLRRFYLSYSPTKNINFQGGAMDPNASDPSVTNLSKNGWVDGGRAVVSNIGSHIDKIAVTVGRLEDFATFNAIERAEYSYTQKPNYYQVHIRGRINDVMKYIVEGTQVDSDRYLRGVLEIAVAKISKDVARLIDTVRVEEITKEGRSHQAFATSVVKSVGQWTFTEQYSYKKSDFALTDVMGSHGDSFFTNPGHQISSTAERKTKIGAVYVRGNKSTGNGISLEPSGYRAEVGVKVNIGKR